VDIIRLLSFFLPLPEDCETATADSILSRRHLLSQLAA
jgi:hypothetical protein